MANPNRNKMYRITKAQFWTTTALAIATIPGMAEAASASGLVRWLDPFNSSQGVYVIGTPSTLELSSTISSPLLGPAITRTITVEKTTGNFLQLLVAVVDSQTNQFVFNNTMGVTGNARVNYGTFAPKDFTSGGQTDSILLGIDTLALMNLGGTPGNVNFQFNFTDQDGTSGTLSRNFDSTLSATNFLLSFDDATESGGNGVLNFTAITAFSFQTAVSGNAIVQSAFKPIAIASSNAPLVFPPLPPSSSFSSRSFAGIIVPNSPSTQDTPSASTPEPGTVWGLLALGIFGIFSRRGVRRKGSINSSF
jgi:PEP-CTERM motif